VRWGGEEWVYVYILLEFQSTVDPSMALRMLVYVGLLYQDLQRQGVRTSSGRLPPVLPVVAYNGNPACSAALDAADLIVDVPGLLEAYRPRLRYFLLDEGRIPEEDLAGRNVFAALVRLEQSREPEDVRRVVEALLVRLAGPEHAGLRRAFAVWIRQVLLPSRLPGVAIPEVADLKEVKSMLAERVVEWTQEWKRQGHAEALEKIRATLVRHLEQRFGPLPAGTRERLQGIGSIEELMDLTLRASGAPSLSSLGL
jgi:hypothetical protein